MLFEDMRTLASLEWRPFAQDDWDCWAGSGEDAHIAERDGITYVRSQEDGIVSIERVDEFGNMSHAWRFQGGAIEDRGDAALHIAKDLHQEKGFITNILAMLCAEHGAETGTFDNLIPFLRQAYDGPEGRDANWTEIDALLGGDEGGGGVDPALAAKYPKLNAIFDAAFNGEEPKL